MSTMKGFEDKENLPAGTVSSFHTVFAVELVFAMSGRFPWNNFWNSL